MIGEIERDVYRMMIEKKEDEDKLKERLTGIIGAESVGLLNKCFIDGYTLNEVFKNGEEPVIKVTDFLIEVNGVKFKSPSKQFYKFVLGELDDMFKTRLGDNRYEQIRSYIESNVMPHIRKNSSKITNSYALHHKITRALGFYVSNETVKVIMAFLGVPTRRSKEEYPLNVEYYYSGNIGE